VGLANRGITFWGFERRDERNGRWIALAMLPACVKAHMAACTWHLFEIPIPLKGLVVLQAFTTLMGNLALAAAAWNLLPSEPQP